MRVSCLAGVRQTTLWVIILYEDVYQDLYEELQLPIIHRINCEHVPRQITFVNGAYAKVEVREGKGKVLQHLI